MKKDYGLKRKSKHRYLQRVKNKRKRLLRKAAHMFARNLLAAQKEK